VLGVQPEETVVDRLGHEPIHGIDGPAPCAHVERAEPHAQWP
jgi:hypothetical protein